ncbi:MAG: hypothetical protein ABIO16_10485 [Nocardioides sp.]
MTPRRSATPRPTLGTRLLILFLIALGAFVLLLAFTRPSAGRFMSAAVLLGAAGVIRHRALKPADPSKYGRAQQMSSLYWSIVIAVVFIGASFLVNQLLTN